MATRGERRALLFLGAVVALGASVRVAGLYSSRTPVSKAARDALETQIKAADSAHHAASRKKTHSAAPKRDQPLPPGPLDLDVASERDIEALRGIGPSLARRIVADRDSFGPFGSLDGLSRVRGVGPALVAKLDSTVTFSLLPRPMNTVIPQRPAGSSERPRHRSGAAATPRRRRRSVDSSGYHP